MVGRTGRVRHAAQNEPGQDGVYQAEVAGSPVRGAVFPHSTQCDSVGRTRYPRCGMWRRVVVRGADILSVIFKQILKVPPESR